MITKQKTSQPREASCAAAIAPPVANLDSRFVAWARPSAEDGKPRPAPGKPGDEPHWAPSAKDGVGTALCPTANSTSLVWFTISHGILTEIFYPRIDQACTRDLGLIVTDGNEFFSEERVDAEHQVEHPVEGVPLYRLANTCRQGRYRIEKTIFAHPHQDTVLQITRFTPLEGRLDDYRLYALLAPHLGNRGANNTAWLDAHLGVPMLFARRDHQALALACSAPRLKGSAGYVGSSDGWQDLSRHKRLAWEYDRAEDGNVALTGEEDLGACGGVFALAVGFGPDPAEAGHRALASLMDDLDGLQQEYTRGWQVWQEALLSPKPSAKGGRDLYRISTAVVQTHDAQCIPGGFIASLSTPWGEARGATTSSGPATWWNRPAACWQPGRGPRRCVRSPTCGPPRWPTGTGPRTCGSAAPGSGREPSWGRPPSRSCSSTCFAATGRSYPRSARGSGRWSGRPSATSSGVARRPSRTAGRTSRDTPRSPWQP